MCIYTNIYYIYTNIYNIRIKTTTAYLTNIWLGTVVHEECWPFKKILSLILVLSWCWQSKMSRLYSLLFSGQSCVEFLNYLTEFSRETILSWRLML